MSVAEARQILIGARECNALPSPDNWIGGSQVWGVVGTDKHLQKVQVAFTLSERFGDVHIVWLEQAAAH